MDLKLRIELGVDQCLVSVRAKEASPRSVWGLCKADPGGRTRLDPVKVPVNGLSEETRTYGPGPKSPKR